MDLYTLKHSKYINNDESKFTSTNNDNDDDENRPKKTFLETLTSYYQIRERYKSHTQKQISNFTHTHTHTHTHTKLPTQTIGQDCGIMETVDKGIDLILRLKDNSFRLIQVKYRHGENGVKDAGGAYKLLGRATQRVGVDRVKLIWLITNGKHPPHYNREYDLQTYVPELIDTIFFLCF